jgi:hypothetical protein
MQTMRITWDDVGRTTQPGWYFIRHARFHLKQMHIDRWLEDPDGYWTARNIVVMSGPSNWDFISFYPSR